MRGRSSHIARSVFNAAASCPVSVILPSVQAVVIALAIIACGQPGSRITADSGGPSSNSVSGSGDGSVSSSVSPVIGVPSQNPGNGGRQSTPAGSSPVRNSRSSTACPMQGVGGDPIPPLCASLSPTATDSLGITHPASASPTPSQCVTPTVTGVSPSQGSAAGGDSVTVTGTGFGGEVQVFFGSAPADAVAIMSSTEITATSPPGQAVQPAVDVTVACNGSVSPTVTADQFTYIATTPSPTATTTAGS